MIALDRARVAPQVLERLDGLLAWAQATFPEVTVEEPWDFPLIKVRGKILFMLVAEGATLHFTAKLRESHADAMDRPNVEPTSHGLGKSGWVTAKASPQWPIDDAQFHLWAIEAFHLIAPKKLVAAWNAERAE